MDEIIDSNVDDLSAFADYLAEFDALMSFDNEDCPVCGVSIPEKITDQKSPFVIFKSYKEIEHTLELVTYLKSKCIPYKIERRINLDVIEKIEYIFDVMIPFRCKFELEKAKQF